MFFKYLSLQTNFFHRFHLANVARHFKENTILIFGASWTKKLFPAQTNERYQRFKRILFSLGIKFDLNQKILAFWTKFAQNGNLRSKRENLNPNIEFSIFELALMPNFIF